MWPQQLGIAIIAQAFWDALQTAPLKNKRDEKRRIEALEDAREFLAGDEWLEYWCRSAGVSPEAVTYAFLQLKEQDKERIIELLEALQLERTNSRQSVRGIGSESDLDGEEEAAAPSRVFENVGEDHLLERWKKGREVNHVCNRTVHDGRGESDYQSGAVFCGSRGKRGAVSTDSECGDAGSRDEALGGSDEPTGAAKCRAA
jgi:hypothetical protein